MRQVKIEHPIREVLKQRMKECLILVLAVDDTDKEIEIRKLAGLEEENPRFIVSMKNGERSKKYAFLINAIVAIYSKDKHLEECFKEDPLTYLDAIMPLIKQGKEICRE